MCVCVCVCVCALRSGRPRACCRAAHVLDKLPTTPGVGWEKYTQLDRIKLPASAGARMYVCMYVCGCMTAGRPRRGWVDHQQAPRRAGQGFSHEVQLLTASDAGARVRGPPRRDVAAWLLFLFSFFKTHVVVLLGHMFLCQAIHPAVWIHTILKEPACCCCCMIMHGQLATILLHRAPGTLQVRSAEVPPPPTVTARNGLVIPDKPGRPGENGAHAGLGRHGRPHTSYICSCKAQSRCVVGRKASRVTPSRFARRLSSDACELFSLACVRACVRAYPRRIVAPRCHVSRIYATAHMSNEGGPRGWGNRSPRRGCPLWERHGLSKTGGRTPFRLSYHPSQQVLVGFPHVCIISACYMLTGCPHAWAPGR